MNKLKLTRFPHLVTDRFLLRQLRIEDEEEIFVLRSDERVPEYLDNPKAGNIKDARKFIEKINRGIAASEWLYWAINHKPDEKLIGTICLWNFSEEESKAEIGFSLLPEYHGQGIMKEIIPVVIDYGFNNLNLQSIEGEVAPANVKSIKLLERFGFVYERKLENTVVYVLKNFWAAG